jgi:hypothetical protein
MLTWVIQITIISFILIFLIHHLINFLKSTLTVPKIKDLVNSPTQKYENMYNIINNSQKSTSNSNLENEYSLIDLLPKNEETNMKSELKNFLKSQLDNSITSENGNGNGNGTGTEITSLDYMSNSNSNSYSNY